MISSIFMVMRQRASPEDPRDKNKADRRWERDRWMLPSSNGRGKWTSVIRPSGNTVQDWTDFQKHNATVCVCVCVFHLLYPVYKRKKGSHHYYHHPHDQAKWRPLDDKSQQTNCSRNFAPSLAAGILDNSVDALNRFHCDSGVHTLTTVSIRKYLVITNSPHRML